MFASYVAAFRAACRRLRFYREHTIQGSEVIPYEKLVQEERNRQIAMAIIAGVGVAANAAAASRAGHGNYAATTYGPRGGVYQTTGSYYSPVAASIAQDRAAAQNDALIAATVETGQRNMAALEQMVMKDNTLLPGEWYGGQLHISPPVDRSGEQKSYQITLNFSGDRHVIDVSHVVSR